MTLTQKVKSVIQSRSATIQTCSQLSICDVRIFRPCHVTNVWNQRLLVSYMNTFSLALFNPLLDDKILDRSKMRQCAADNFRCHENSRKFSKRVENTVGKEKLFVTSNFSFSHSVFKRLVSQGLHKVSLCGKGLNKYHTMMTFDACEEKVFWKHCSLV